MTKKKDSILFVCLGNICRSPTADALGRLWVQNHGLDWQIDSAGTSGWHAGEPPHSQMIKVALGHNVDMRSLQSRQVIQADFLNFDHIVAMDQQNFLDLREICPREFQKKIYLLLNATDFEDKNVPDPYYGGPEGFEKCFRIVEVGVNAFMHKLKKGTIECA